MAASPTRLLCPTSEKQPLEFLFSTKITKLLSSSYADYELRDALQTLDEQNLRNTAETRRNLRLDVQKDVIECNGVVINDFSHVATQLRNVGNALASLQQTCAEMRQHISQARIETAPMLDEANALLAQREATETKQHLLNAFNEHFLLSDDELTILSSPTDPVRDNFFQVLVKAKQINKDSQVLLGGENQRLGLEIMEQSSRHLNAAFQKLFRWIQREFKTLDLENPHMNASIRRALRVLAERPTLFQNCLDTFAESRERSLSESFYAALTGSEFGDSQKPIEFSAHDPLRYVGDMLAWTHSATVSENEALEMLLISDGEEIGRSIQHGLESEPWSRSEVEEKFDGRKVLNQLVNRSLSGVGQHLRQRVDQVVHGHDEPVLAYKIYNLISFYREIFRKLVQESEFMETLDALQTTALERFRTTIRFHVASIENDQLHAPDDLMPPEFLEDALEELQPMLKSYETSTLTSDGGDEALKFVLEEAFDPFIHACNKIARELPLPSNDVFDINCLLAAKRSLQNYSFAESKVVELDETIERGLMSLIGNQHAYFLDKSGMQQLVAVAASLSLDSEEDISKVLDIPEFQPDRLASASEQLDQFLPSALVDAAENVKLLRHAEAAGNVNAEAAEKFCEDFEIVEDIIMKADDLTIASRANTEQQDDTEEQEPPLLRDLFPRTSKDIRILLS